MSRAGKGQAKEMTNVEDRMTKEILSSNDEPPCTPLFELRYSPFLRHRASPFVIGFCWIGPLPKTLSPSPFPFRLARPKLMRLAKIRIAPGTPSGNWRNQAVGRQDIFPEP